MYNGIIQSHPGLGGGYPDWDIKTGEIEDNSVFFGAATRAGMVESDIHNRRSE